MPVLRVLKEMEVGDVREFPPEKIWNIRTYCALLKRTNQLKCCTRINREKQIYEVSRIS